MNIFKKIQQIITEWCLEESELTVGELHQSMSPIPVQIYNNDELKFIESGKTNNYFVKTPTGYSKVKQSLKTVKYRVYTVCFSDNTQFQCADTHIVISDSGNQVFVNDLNIGDKIKSIDGFKTVTDVLIGYNSEHMYDLELDDHNHVFYTDGILSHNTETSIFYILWYCMFHENKTALIVSNKGSSSMEIIGRIQYAYEELPNWLKAGIDENSWNKHECAFDNKSRIVSTTTSKDSGRGLPLSLVYSDEIAFIPKQIQSEFFASIIPTLSHGGKMIITSTPNGDDDLFAALWRGAEMGTNEYTNGKIFVPWTAPPERDDAYKQKMIGILGERTWKQEYECEFLTSEQTLVDSYVVSQLEKYIIANTTIQFTVADIAYWKRINPSASYIVACDPATGSGEDFSVIEVFEFPSLEQVAEWRSNTLSIPALYTVLKNVLRFLERFCDNIYFSVENNGVGQGVLSLYEADENAPEKSFLISDEGKNKLGITTTVKNKTPSCLRLKQMIENNTLKLHSLIATKELKNFVRLEGTYRAKVGATDDCISALLVIMRILENMAEYDANAYDKIYSDAINMYSNQEDDELYSSKNDDDDDFSMPQPFFIL